MTEVLLLVLGLLACGMLALALYHNGIHVKIAMLTIFLVLGNAVYFSLDGVKGWPDDTPGEVKGVIAYIIVVNPTENDKGGIYIGYYPSTETKWFEYDYPYEAPKNIRIEYSNDRASKFEKAKKAMENCLLYTSPSPRDRQKSRMPSSA